MASKFEVHLGSEWRKFDAQVGELLAEAIRLGAGTCQFQDRGQNYIVDFASMTQRNIATGKEREIRVTFQDETQARGVAEARAGLAAQADAAAREAEEAAAREEQEWKDREAAAAAAAAEEDRLAREAAAAAAEDERLAAREAEEAAAREAEEAAARAAREAEDERSRKEAEEKARALEGDRLAIGVKLDEEGTALWKEGKLAEAKQKLIQAAAVLRFVHRWDPRTKSAAVKATLGSRIDQVAERLERIEDELRLPPMGGGGAGVPAASATRPPSVPAASVKSAVPSVPAASAKDGLVAPVQAAPVAAA